MAGPTDRPRRDDLLDRHRWCCYCQAMALPDSFGGIAKGSRTNELYSVFAALMRK